MRHLRFVTLALALLAAAGATFAGAAAPRSQAPQNLRAFLLRPDEAGTHVFARTPAFAWSPVRGARCYEFELATSKQFSQSALIWSNVQYTVGRHSVCASVPASSPTAPAASSSAPASTTTTTTAPGAAPAVSDPAVQSVIPPLRVPAVSIDVALPWFTGTPYALFAHVRAITANGATEWSKAFGFNMRWPEIAQPLKADAGLIRWTPVAGATSYQVWFTDAGKVFGTHTNVADEREYYTFHTDASWTGSVHWRVRAVRRVFGDIPNGLPAVSFGPWSPIYTNLNPALNTGPLTLREAISDRTSTAGKQSAHELQPALSYTGTTVGGRAYGLFRTYISTDRDCVNVVYRGPVTGAPAYAPRTTGPMVLPTDDTTFATAQTSYLKDGDKEGPTFAADGSALLTNEATSGASASAAAAAASGSAGTSDPGQLVQGAKVDLPDLNFPTTRYYWTVVPVVILVDPVTNAWTYDDAQVPQDACQSGRVMSFGKESKPVVTTGTTPYVAGLTPKGRLLAVAGKHPVVYGTPLVAWEPTIAAGEYEVQWAKHPYPWNAKGDKFTYSTSTLLSLAPGVWYYRVRGLNLGQLRNPYMSWSTPIRVVVARPKFSLISG